jgi:hypothetical protein
MELPCSLAGNAGDIGAGNAQIGQFAVGQGLKLRNRAVIALPGVDTRLENFEHLSYSSLNIRMGFQSIISLLYAPHLGAPQQKEKCKICMPSNTCAISYIYIALTIIKMLLHCQHNGQCLPHDRHNVEGFLTICLAKMFTTFA